MSEAPAKIKATQKVQRQETTDTKPEIMGDMTGPHVVAC